MDDLPPGFDDPVDALLGFHRRIERQLATLGRITYHLEMHGLDAEGSAMAAGVLDFFTSSLALHHLDEEALFPLLEMRIASVEERERLRLLRARLESEHREMDRMWRSLKRPLEGIAEGINRGVPADLLQYFRAMQATHISIEEGVLHVAAAKTLTPSDRAALGRGMVARRTRRRRFA
ncbi:MAG TPA: hemerythrin domain-containing protein [Usitatibacter sp.]|nr:hemerythrin domain-containing protein [Usitatibacter sp.]